MKTINSFPFAALLLALAGCASSGLQQNRDSAATAITATVAENSAPAPVISNIIIGGGMFNCSSVNGPNTTNDNSRCTQPWSEILKRDPAFTGLSMNEVSFEPAVSLPTFTYSITAERIAALTVLPHRLLSRSHQALLTTRLNAYLDEHDRPKTGLSFAIFDEILSGRADHSEPIKLSMLELAAVRHNFVEQLSTEHAKRVVQARSVIFMTNHASQEIYRTFVQAARAAAGGAKPKIGLVTASAANPFNDHDMYDSALRSAGANVVWLPFDGGFRTALDTGDCAHAAIYYSAYSSVAAERPNFHMDKVFPDLAALQNTDCQDNAKTLNTQLQTLDGVFFTGGNQARHMQSFITRDQQGNYTEISAQLKILQERFAEGKLVVAGSSAGDSAQSGGLWKGKPVPMIGGGESWKVLANGFANGADSKLENRDLRGTTYTNGGLGFFNFGPLDSHFSNRAREARLVRLVKDSGMDYGFGIDENTALVVSRPDASGNTSMSVLGAGGVFIADTRSASASGNENGSYAIKHVVIHYLTAGDSASVDQDGKLSVQLSPTKPVLAANPSAPAITQNRIMEFGSLNFVKMTQAMGRSGASAALGTSAGSAGQDAPIYSASLARGPTTTFRANPDGLVSYSDLLLAYHPCAPDCSAAP
jgi:cyanophycinase